MPCLSCIGKTTDETDKHCNTCGDEIRFFARQKLEKCDYCMRPRAKLEAIKDGTKICEACAFSGRTTPISDDQVPKVQPDQSTQSKESA